MGMAGHVVGRWKEQNGRVLALNARVMGRVGLVFAATKFIRMALQVGITGLGAWLVLDHAITPGSMIASSLLMGRALAPFEQAVGGWKGWSSACAAFRRIQDSLKRPQLAPSAARFPAPDGMLEVNNVRYCPPGQSDLILRGVSFTLKAGNILVIVGPSGAGKSTLARVIAGAWRPTGGEIRLDGVDLATWERDDLGRHVGYLPQNVQLLSGTVAQNISRFDPDPSFETIIAAAREAGVHDMILRLPQGYETVIGEWGLQLSGGQQQRIGLARAVYGNPRLIILDEPNSNLDPDGEAALVEAIHASRRAGRTIVAISHRASLLRSADWVIVMRDGVIEKAGARDAVMASLSGSASLHGDGARLPQAAVS
jgi:PrtD family type I secretion system ABC transporter